ncbi:MAG TPA: hypothetical protein VGJ81_18525 [Thermoanaerobaculia bacterium]
MARAARGARRLHAVGIPAQQRLHLAALLIALALPFTTPAFAADVSFQPTITDADFARFARLVGQAIYATPVQPARATGFLGFDVGIAATAVPIDDKAAYWTKSVSGTRLEQSGYLAVPRLVASKGFGAGTLSGTYASRGDIKMYGGSLDIPLVRGSVATPEIGLRGAYSTLRGIESFNMKTYGVEAFISKGFGPVMPYGAIGRQRNNASGSVDLSNVPVATAGRSLSDRANVNRYTAGVRLSLLLPKITVEATKAEVTSYTAKISFGF